MIFHIIKAIFEDNLSPYPCVIGDLRAEGQFFEVLSDSLASVNIESPAESSHLQVTKDGRSRRCFLCRDGRGPVLLMVDLVIGPWEQNLFVQRRLIVPKR